jgi:hypothetical protein
MFFPVFFWYLLREASRVWFNCEEEPGVRAGEDIAMMSGGGPEASAARLFSDFEV